MGRNTRNHVNTSRRFAPCYMLAGLQQHPAPIANRIAPDLYLALLDRYQVTKATCQDGKAGHDRHVESIRQIREYLESVDYLISHN